MFIDFSIKDLIDILLVAYLLYQTYRLMKDSGSINIFTGILVFIGIWLIVSQVLEMKLLGSIFDKLVSVGVLALIILFQDELRRFLVTLGSHKRLGSFFRFLTGNKQEKTEKAQKSWAQREQNLQAEAAQLQQKYEKGLITSRDAQAQQESIQKKVASYQSNAQKEAQTLDEENYVFTNRAQDLLHRAVQEINSGKKYKLILNASALIDADTTLNITPAVLAKVNELYAADKKAEKK